ncbi:hypothetical protein BGZ75_000304 [Mortierella antarctica]|nr:hypothetical protein BGZ67_003372 [Mortierella alpina]KAF9987657.1 hypothetical protein BGZ75_000304 [Mortierella antarctica]
MRLSALSLLALAGSALASHDACFKYSSGGFTGVWAAVIVRDPFTTLMQEREHFAPFVSTMTFKNSKGRVDVNMKGGWSCVLNGVNHGGFNFQKMKDIGDNGYIRYGCYDISGDGYCDDADSKYIRCLESFSD